ncbi:hypothetical protein E7T09_04285 [Deinococcus sp. KSM4-11]|uniref:hypothetical protein n=1 Tax=Deinococcus sp. KSM4-11 TaxID=2568654 RepID=UPI0010A548CF|nr:hypothetical protein [Deinococcus sp. KSM4-11]THF88432.1 hypothetical protein E7T09_04285 [Deinococcus sp. KSM4-11]
MTYDTTHLAADFIGYLKNIQEHAGHQPHALKLARDLNMRVRIGTINRAYPEAQPNPVLVVQPWYYGNTWMLRHELAHVMLYWSGLEAEVIEEFGSEVGWKVIENLCQQAEAFLLITQPMVDDAVRRFGVSAQAVRHLQKLSGARPEVALRRLIYDNPHAERAGFLMSRDYVTEVAQCNFGLPFGWSEKVSKPAQLFGSDARLTFTRRFGLGVGVVGW